MRRVVWMLVLLLMVLHQDFWFWHRYEPLLFGFIPIGLAWHVGISLAAGVVGLLAVRYCWPESLEADEALPPPGGDRPLH